MYLLINNNKINIIEYKSFFKKFIGLMNKKEIISFCIRLNKCNSIHTFFMKQNIDVCITNKNNVILFLKSNMNKNKIILPIKKGYYTYELPLNMATYLKLNTKLEIKR